MLSHRLDRLTRTRAFYKTGTAGAQAVSNDMLVHGINQWQPASVNRSKTAAPSAIEWWVHLNKVCYNCLKANTSWVELSLMMAFWPSAHSGVGHMKVVAACQTWLVPVLGWMAAAGVQILVTEIYLSLTSHPGQLSLAILPWVPAVVFRPLPGKTSSSAMAELALF